MTQYNQSWLELEKAFGGRFTVNGSPAEIREQFAGLAAAISSQVPPPSSGVVARDDEVDGIPYRIYTPVDATPGERLPVVGYTHGGGFVLGNLDMEDALCRAISEDARSIVISVDYRLSPEHPSPVHLEDAVRVFENVLEDENFDMIDATKFFTVGTSAGGALALSVANHFITKAKASSESASKIVVKGVAAIAPITLHPDNIPADFEAMYTSYQEFKTGSPCIDQGSMRGFFAAAGVQPTDKSYLAALKSENHGDFPPTYIVTCACDPLRDDGTVMAHALRNVGVPVHLDHYDGLPHLFWMFPMLPEYATFVTNLVKGVKWLLELM